MTKLDRARATVRRTTALLEIAAKDYAGGLIDFITLETIAKKHTNARHEEGRQEKHVRFWQDEGKRAAP
jgi:UTP:GlnB (protein PII) uridylyltransferase